MAAASLTKSDPVFSTVSSPVPLRTSKSYSQLPEIVRNVSFYSLRRKINIIAQEALSKLQKYSQKDLQITTPPYFLELSYKDFKKSGWGVDDYGHGFFIFVFSKVIQDGLLKVHTARHVEYISDCLKNFFFQRNPSKVLIPMIRTFYYNFCQG